MPAKLNRRSLQKCKKHRATVIYHCHSLFTIDPSFTPQSMVNIAHSLIWMSCPSPSPNRKPSLQLAVLVISQDCLQIFFSLSLSLFPCLSLSLLTILSISSCILSRLMSRLVPARSSLPHHLRLHRPYSTTPPSSSSSSPSAPKRPPSKSPPTSSSNFKIFPFLALIALGSGSYAFLVKSRANNSSPA